jgi:hypothetical protein
MYVVLAVGILQFKLRLSLRALFKCFAVKAFSTSGNFYFKLETSHTR